MALRRLKAGYKTYNIWAFDTETDEDGNFKLGVIYNPLDDDYEVFYNAFDMAKSLLRPIGKHHEGRHYMAGFNVPYDLNTLHPYFRLNRLENKGNFITCTTSKNSDRSKNKYRYFSFIDLSNFCRQGTSLKELSGNLNVNYIDVHDYKDPFILDACKSHAKSVSEILQKFQKVINEDFESNLKLTVASTAMDVFQRKFLREGHGVGKECKPDTICDHKGQQGQSYRGGITEMFNKNYFKSVVCVDIKSMYPYIMKNLTIPNMNKCSNILYKSNVEDYLNNFEGCAELTVKIPKNMYFHPFLIKNNGKLQSMWGDVTGVFTFSEIRYMLELGIKIKYCDWIIQFKRRENFFTDFVDYLYKYKSKDKTGVYKLVMNSLYGKFGQKHKYDTGFKVIEEGGVYNIEECYELNGVIYDYLPEDKEIKEYHRKAYPLIASYVTAGARIYLYQEMLKVGLDKIIYCDTDSLVINDSEENIKKKLEIKNELGKWEIKFKGEFQARGLKYYRYRETNNDNWEYVIKGVPEKYKAEFWENNKVVVKRPIKFNTAIRSKGKKKLNKWVSFTLTSKNPPLKRKFFKNGVSEMIKYKP